MRETNWNNVFEEKIERRRGLSEAGIARFVATVMQPISDEEVKYRLGDNASRWKLPEGPLPRSYLSFLRWSDGGEFRNGNRLIQFFPALDRSDGVRIMMLLYAVPEYLPGLLPFASNGGGVFYAFDMRMRPAANGEYPIVAAECGHAHTPFFLTSSFRKTCGARTSIDDLWDKANEVLEPKCRVCEELLVCPACGRKGKPFRP